MFKCALVLKHRQIRNKGTCRKTTKIFFWAHFTNLKQTNRRPYEKVNLNSSVKNHFVFRWAIQVSKMSLPLIYSLQLYLNWPLAWRPRSDKSWSGFQNFPKNEKYQASLMLRNFLKCKLNFFPEDLHDGRTSIYDIFDICM